MPTPIPPPKMMMPADELAPTLPLRYDSTSKYAYINDYTTLVNQNLKMLLLTVPGEKMMDTDFGVGLTTYLFEQNTVQTRSSISGKIREQVQLYLPYIDIENIEYHSSIEDSQISDEYLGIRITYNIVPIQTVVVSTLNLSGDSSLGIFSSFEIANYST
tara:strand:- start:25039 stop:25515 length:477 start_codon:yes stop_codon:yes gene_type:complete